MTKRKPFSPDALEAGLLPNRRKPIPHAFVLDAISTLSPYTRPMFGCLAIYVKDKIVLILRDKPTNTADNGVWLATTQEHHQSLRREFPNMRSIQVLGKPVTGWQVLPVDAPDFESAALRACELVPGWRCSDRCMLDFWIMSFSNRPAHSFVRALMGPPGSRT